MKNIFRSVVALLFLSSTGLFAEASNPVPVKVKIEVINGEYDESPDKIAYDCVSGKPYDALVVKATLDPSWIPVSSITWTVEGMDHHEQLSAIEYAFYKHIKQGVGTVTIDVDYEGPNGSTGTASETLSVAIVDVESIEITPEKVCTGDDLTFKATMDPNIGSLNLKKIPVWEYDEKDSNGSYSGTWTKLNETGTEFTITQQKYGRYKTRAKCDDDSENYSNEVENEVFPKIKEVTLADSDLNPKQKLLEKSGNEKVTATVTFEESVSYLWAGLIYEFKNVDTGAKTEAKKSKETEEELTVTSPAKYVVTVNHDDPDLSCDDAESEEFIRYEYSVTSLARYDWPDANDIRDQLYKPITDDIAEKVKELKTYQKLGPDYGAAGSLLEGSYNAGLSKVNDYIKDLEKAEKNANDNGLSKADLESQIGDLDETIKSLETDVSHLEKDIQILEAEKVSLDPDSVRLAEINAEISSKNIEIRNLESSLTGHRTAREALDTRLKGLVAYLNDLSIRLAKIRPIAKRMTDIQTTVGSSSNGYQKIANVASDLSKEFDKVKALMDSDFIQAVGKYGGPLLDVFGVVIDVVSILDAENKIIEAEQAMQAYENFPDDVQKQMDELVFTRVTGPVQTDKPSTITSTPGGVDFKLKEEVVWWQTKEELFDKDGNDKWEEDDSSSFENIFTYNSTKANDESKKFTTSSGATGTIDITIYAHGNLGSSNMRARDFYSDDAADSSSWTLCLAKGDDEKKMLDLADLAKTEVEGEMEIYRITAQAIKDGISALASLALIFVGIMTAVSGGTLAIIGVVVSVVILFIGSLIDWIFSSPTAKSIKYLYPELE
jgi:predicted  nucleic acid-binding Zn-ribbon protein